MQNLPRQGVRELRMAWRLPREYKGGLVMKPHPTLEWKLINGDWSPRPVAYCMAHKGYLTKNLRKLHRCKQRQCMHLRPVKEAEK